jgi:hypothetical protein
VVDDAGRGRVDTGCIGCGFGGKWMGLGSSESVSELSRGMSTSGSGWMDGLSERDFGIAKVIGDIGREWLSKGAKVIGESGV